ncbi:hypothetical protein HDV02_004502 [Globomyces sp. JEL0801]|nr:hypothetical protein HDV02_004502 [Globomyces sp. JEL0801]
MTSFGNKYDQINIKNNDLEKECWELATWLLLSLSSIPSIPLISPIVLKKDDNLAPDLLQESPKLSPVKPPLTPPLSLSLPPKISLKRQSDSLSPPEKKVKLSPVYTPISPTPTTNINPFNLISPTTTITANNSIKNAPKNNHKNRRHLVRQCSHCLTTVSPLWRYGPPGYNTLCNACGVKWKRGSILTHIQPLENRNHNKGSKSTIKNPFKPSDKRIICQKENGDNNNDLVDQENLDPCSDRVTDKRDEGGKNTDHLNSRKVDHSGHPLSIDKETTNVIMTEKKIDYNEKPKPTLLETNGSKSQSNRPLKMLSVVDMNQIRHPLHISKMLFKSMRKSRTRALGASCDSVTRYANDHPLADASSLTNVKDALLEKQESSDPPSDIALDVVGDVDSTDSDDLGSLNETHTEEISNDLDSLDTVQKRPEVFRDTCARLIPYCVFRRFKSDHYVETLSIPLPKTIPYPSTQQPELDPNPPISCQPTLPHFYPSPSALSLAERIQYVKEHVVHLNAPRVAMLMKILDPWSQELDYALTHKTDGVLDLNNLDEETWDRIFVVVGG